MAFLYSMCVAEAWANITSKKDTITVSEVRTIIDGDSFKVNIDHWPAIIGKSITVRIADIDTPELRGKCQKEKDLARKAKQFSVEKLRNAKAVELKDIKRGKYFRIVANVYIDGVSLGGELLKQGLAVIYSKKSKMNWCNHINKKDS